MKRYTVLRTIAEIIWVGIDLHRVHWHITIRSEVGELFSGSIPGNWEALKRILEQYPAREVHAVYEAGYFGFWLYDSLTQWGAHCIVTPPSLVPQQQGNRVKTDRRDSSKLAFYLMKGMLKGVWVPGTEHRSHREVLRRRQKLVEDRVRVQSRIKASLQFHGVDVGVSSKVWSQRYIRALSSLQWTNRWHEENLRRLLEQYAFLCQQIKAQTTLVDQLADDPLYAKNLMLLRTMKGVGVLSGMEFLLELPPMTEFHRSEQLAAYVGLTPAQHSSGEHVRMGSITRAGRTHLRATLIELGWRAVAKDPGIRAVYDRIKGRAGSKRAIVAVARRLLLCLRRIILDQQPYVTHRAA